MFKYLLFASKVTVHCTENGREIEIQCSTWKAHLQSSNVLIRLLVLAKHSEMLSRYCPGANSRCHFCLCEFPHNEENECIWENRLIDLQAMYGNISFHFLNCVQFFLAWRKHNCFLLFALSVIGRCNFCYEHSKNVTDIFKVPKMLNISLIRNWLKQQL